MLTTTAAVWNGGDATLEMEELRIVEPGPGEVLVGLRASGICHSDYHVVTGHWARPTPIVLGHEGAGVVERVGEGVTGVQPGDHVILSWTPYCGRCHQCLRARPVLCEVAEATRGLMGASPRLWRDEQPVFSGAGVGAFSQYTVVPESGAIPIRNDVPFEIAAIVGCAVMTGLGAAINTAGVRPGSSVLIIGCGGVGLSIVLGATLAAAAQVIVVDRVAAKLELASELGATSVVDASVADVAEQVADLTNGRGVDYAFEAIGNPRTIELAYDCVAAGGSAVVVGQVPDGVKVSIDPFIMSDREKTLRGSNYGSSQPALDFPMITDFYAEGRLNLDRLIARRLPLKEINDGFAALATGESARSVIVHEARA